MSTWTKIALISAIVAFWVSAGSSEAEEMTIQGTITDSTNNGAAIEGVLVEIIEQQMSDTTDANGLYIITGITPGNFTIKATKGDLKFGLRNNSYIGYWPHSIEFLWTVPNDSNPTEDDWNACYRARYPLYRVNGMNCGDKWTKELFIGANHDAMHNKLCDGSMVDHYHYWVDYGGAGMPTVAQGNDYWNWHLKDYFALGTVTQYTDCTVVYNCYCLVFSGMDTLANYEVDLTGAYLYLTKLQKVCTKETQNCSTWTPGCGDICLLCFVPGHAWRIAGTSTETPATAIDYKWAESPCYRVEWFEGKETNCAPRYKGIYEAPTMNELVGEPDIYRWPE